jgi:hypothetical protein
LEDEHRTLDLRDPAALDRHRQRIDALRQNIAALSRDKNRSRDAGSYSGSAVQRSGRP